MPSVCAGPLRGFWAVTHCGLVIEGSTDSLQKGPLYHGVSQETSVYGFRSRGVSALSQSLHQGPEQTCHVTFKQGNATWKSSARLWNQSRGCDLPCC